ncbi:MAG: ArsC family transcriptional regulator [Clostridia bacterium]|nr:ArsC family transcriptional regulator [Clostridia bacterium]
MSIQIFVKSKSFDCKKAERFFKERGIKFQRIDLEDKGMSKGEYNSVKAGVGGDFHKLIDKKCKLYDKLFIAHLAYPAQIEEKLLENPGLFAAPIVRNGRAVTVGVDENTWKKWIEDEAK